MSNVAYRLVLCLLAFTLGIQGAGAAESSAEDSGTDSAVDLGGSDDWDWSAVTEMDDAPVIAPSAGAGKRALEDYVPPAEVENAFPDFDSPPREAYAIFKGVPPFEVIPSMRDPGMHPCSNCHQWVKSNLEVRNLKRPHDSFKLEHGLHGKGKFWCFTCHDLEGAGGLKTLEGEKLDFNDAYVLCSQCHSRQARDWVYGAHGKRVSGWQGKRQVLNCTACHYQHRPAFKPRQPKPGPNIRMGLERPAHWVARGQRPFPDHGNHESWKEVQHELEPVGGQNAEADDRVIPQGQGDGERS